MKTYQINELNDNIDNMTLTDIVRFLHTYNILSRPNHGNVVCCNVVAKFHLKKNQLENVSAMKMNRSNPLNGFKTCLKRIATIFFSRFFYKNDTFHSIFLQKETRFVHHFHHFLGIFWHVVGLHHGVNTIPLSVSVLSPGKRAPAYGTVGSKSWGHHNVY